MSAPGQPIQPSPPDPSHLGHIDFFANPENHRASNTPNPQITLSRSALAEMGAKMSKQQALESAWDLGIYPVRTLATTHTAANLIKPFFSEGPFIDIDGEKIPIESFSSAGLAIIRDNLLFARSMMKGYSLSARYTTIKYVKACLDLLTAQAIDPKIPSQFKNELDETIGCLQTWLGKETQALRQEGLEFGLDLAINTVPVTLKTIIAALHDLNLVNRAPITTFVTALKWTVFGLYVVQDGIAAYKAHKAFEKHSGWLAQIQEDQCISKNMVHKSRFNQTATLRREKDRTKESFEQYAQPILANGKSLVEISSQLKKKGVNLSKLMIEHKSDWVCYLTLLMKDHGVDFDAAKAILNRPLSNNADTAYMEAQKMVSDMRELFRGNADLLQILEDPDCSLVELKEAVNVNGFNREIYLKNMREIFFKEPIQNAMRTQYVHHQEAVSMMTKKALKTLELQKHCNEITFTKWAWTAAKWGFVVSLVGTALAGLVEILLMTGAIVAFAGLTSMPWLLMIVAGVVLTVMAIRMWRKNRGHIYHDLWNIRFYVKREWKKIGLALQHVLLQRMWIKFIEKHDKLSIDLAVNDNPEKAKRLEKRLVKLKNKIQKKQIKILERKKELDPMDAHVTQIKLKDFLETSKIYAYKHGQAPHAPKELNVELGKTLTEAIMEVSDSEYGKDLRKWLSDHMGIDMSKMSSNPDLMAKETQQALNSFYGLHEGDLLATKG